MFGQMTFGSIQFRENDVRANNTSWKWRSAERWFMKMTFGYTTIRENNVRLNNDAETCRSALWSLGNSTIRLCDDLIELRSVTFFRRDNNSVKLLSVIFFRYDNDSVKWRCGITTIRWNDVLGKWCGSLYAVTTIREKNVRLNDDAETCHSAF